MDDSTPNDFTRQYIGHDTFMPYVLNRTTAAVNADFQTFLRSHDMTLLHWRVLAFLSERDGLGVSALAGVTGVDQATLSRALTVMENAGYIARVPSPNDQRMVAIKLKPAGKRQFGKVLPTAWLLHERAVKGLSREEQIEFQRLLKKIWGNLAG
jgi:DNA-binding MarR family transcriptional regulator